MYRHYEVVLHHPLFRRQLYLVELEQYNRPSMNMDRGLRASNTGL